MAELDDLQDPAEETVEAPDEKQDAKPDTKPEEKVTEPASEGKTDDETEVKEKVAEESSETAKPPEDVPYHRFKEVNESKKQAEMDAQYWREQALKSQIKKPDADEYDKPKPRLEEFDDIEEYYSSLASWEFDKREFNKAQENKANESVNRQENFWSKIAQGSSKYEDFQQVMFLPTMKENQATTDAMVHALSDSEYTADIVYYFGKNKSEAVRIASLPPVLAAREIGKLEAKMASMPKAKKKTTETPTTPTSPSGPGEPPPTKNEEDMSIEEWNAWYDKKTGVA